MKTLLLLSSLFLTVSAAAKPVDDQRTLEIEMARQKGVHLKLAEPDRPYEIVGQRFTFSGIAVQAVKAEKPLQLLNPIAPEQYGSGHDNVTREPTTGNVNGLKIFSIRF